MANAIDNVDMKVSENNDDFKLDPLFTTKLHRFYLHGGIDDLTELKRNPDLYLYLTYLVFRGRFEGLDLIPIEMLDKFSFVSYSLEFKNKLSSSDMFRFCRFLTDLLLSKDKRPYTVNSHAKFFGWFFSNPSYDYTEFVYSITSVFGKSFEKSYKQDEDVEVFVNSDFYISAMIVLATFSAFKPRNNLVSGVIQIAKNLPLFHFPDLRSPMLKLLRHVFEYDISIPNQAYIMTLVFSVIQGYRECISSESELVSYTPLSNEINKIIISYIDISIQDRVSCTHIIGACQRLFDKTWSDSNIELIREFVIGNFDARRRNDTFIIQTTCMISHWAYSKSSFIAMRPESVQRILSGLFKMLMLKWSAEHVDSYGIDNTKLDIERSERRVRVCECFEIICKVEGMRDVISKFLDKYKDSHLWQENIAWITASGCIIDENKDNTVLLKSIIKLSKSSVDAVQVASVGVLAEMARYATDTKELFSVFIKGLESKSFKVRSDSLIALQRSISYRSGLELGLETTEFIVDSLMGYIWYLTSSDIFRGFLHGTAYTSLKREYNGRSSKDMRYTECIKLVENTAFCFDALMYNTNKKQGSKFFLKMCIPWAKILSLTRATEVRLNCELLKMFHEFSRHFSGIDAEIDQLLLDKALDSFFIYVKPVKKRDTGRFADSLRSYGQEDAITHALTLVNTQIENVCSIDIDRTSISTLFHRLLNILKGVDTYLEEVEIDPALVSQSWRAMENIADRISNNPDIDIKLYIPILTDLMCEYFVPQTSVEYEVKSNAVAAICVLNHFNNSFNIRAISYLANFLSESASSGEEEDECIDLKKTVSFFLIVTSLVAAGHVIVQVSGKQRFETWFKCLGSICKNEDKSSSMNDDKEEEKGKKTTIIDKSLLETTMSGIETITRAGLFIVTRGSHSHVVIEFITKMKEEYQHRPDYITRLNAIESLIKSYSEKEQETVPMT